MSLTTNDRYLLKDLMRAEERAKQASIEAGKAQENLIEKERVYEEQAAELRRVRNIVRDRKIVLP